MDIVQDYEETPALILGVVKSNAEHIYDFIYMVPEEFKIIIVTENSQVIVSPLINP